MPVEVCAEKQLEGKKNGVVPFQKQMKLNMSSQVYVSLFKVILGRGAPYGDFLISNTSRCAVYSLLS